MPRRAAQSLLGAAIGVALLAITWVLAFHVGVFERADRSILTGFGDLSQHPHVSSVARFIAELCNPNPYVYLAAIPVGMALVRRRGWLAVAVCAILFGANETAQLLKPLLAQTRVAPVLGINASYYGSWPSGHATAAMALALCCVLAAAPRWRPWVAAAGAVFAVAVSYSFLSLAWHYPSDVFGGFLIAATWTLLAIAAMLLLGGRRAQRQAEGGERVTLRDALAPPAVALVGALVLAGLVLVARPHQVVAYVNGHQTFVIGAAAIAALALALATGLMLVTTRLSGSGPAATAAPRRHWPRARG